VVPQKGLAFFSVWSDGSTAFGLIERADMDGLNRRRIVSNDNRIQWPSSLTADTVHDKLYWADTFANQVGVCDYHGRQRKIILAYMLAHPFGLGMFEDYLYIANLGTDTMTKVSKFDGQARVIFHRGDIKSEFIKIVHKVLQYDGINYCANATCANLCLLKPYGHSCACNSGYSLLEDGSCILDEDKKSFDVLRMCNTAYCHNGGTCFMGNDNEPICSCLDGFVGRFCNEMIISELEEDTSSTFAWVMGVILICLMLIFAIIVMSVANKGPRHFSRQLPKMKNPKFLKSNPLKNISIRFDNPVFKKFVKKQGDSLVKDTDDDYEESDYYQASPYNDTVVPVESARNLQINNGSFNERSFIGNQLTKSESGSPLLRCETDISICNNSATDELDHFHSDSDRQALTGDHQNGERPTNEEVTFFFR